MTRAAIAIAIVLGCGHEATKPAAPARDLCNDYRDVVNAARGEPGDVDVEARNACGCPGVLHTTAARAAAARDTLARVEAAKRMCWVNCDQPCMTDDSRW